MLIVFSAFRGGFFSQIYSLFLIKSRCYNLRNRVIGITINNDSVILHLLRFNNGIMEGKNSTVIFYLEMMRKENRMFINKHLIKFIKGIEKRIFWSCFCELLLTLLGTNISLCTAVMIRMILGERGVWIFDDIRQIFVMIIMSLFFQYFISKKKVLLANQCGMQIKENLRKKLMYQLFDLGPAFVSSERTGDIANIISNKVEWLNNYYTVYLPTAVSGIINAVLLLGVLCQFDCRTVLICSVSFLGILVCPMVFYHLMKERGEREWILL